jgi:hypothetical protein
MKVKIEDLDGIALDWAVAVCEGGEGLSYDSIGTWWIRINGRDRALSTGWSQSQNFAPRVVGDEVLKIIDREGIGVRRNDPCSGGRQWEASPSSTAKKTRGGWGYHRYGPTPAIAILRCYVANTLGPEIEVPDELMACSNREADASQDQADVLRPRSRA